jgi:hypothetical protein
MVQQAQIRVEADHARRYPGSDKLATECVVNLVRTESLVAAEVNGRLRRFGLTGSTFNVLMILDGAPGLLDTLQRQGLVRRIPHPGDRRMLLIELTETGRTMLRKTWRTHFPAQTEMMSVLSDPEKEALVRLLGKLQAHLEARAKRAT